MHGAKQFSKAELLELDSKNHLHLLIHGKVYDIREFQYEHPGGDLVLLGEGGKDATKAFDDIEHSEEAKELMEEYLVGYCSEYTKDLTEEKQKKNRRQDSAKRLPKAVSNR